MPTASPTGRVGELAGVGVEAEREAAVVAAGLLPALVGQRHGVRQVALVSAYVEVFGTAPGMFATQ